jgi:hypothetical protein
MNKGMRRMVITLLENSERAADLPSVRLRSIGTPTRKGDQHTGGRGPAKFSRPGKIWGEGVFRVATQKVARGRMPKF